MNVAATWLRLSGALITSRCHGIFSGLTKRVRHCALDYTYFFEANARAAACEQEAYSIGEHLQDDDPPGVGNFDTSVFGFDGVGENFRNFLVA